MAGETLTGFTIEAWTYLGLSLVIIAIRFGTRWRMLGLTGLGPDDFLMVLAGVSSSLPLSLFPYLYLSIAMLNWHTMLTSTLISFFSQLRPRQPTLSAPIGRVWLIMRKLFAPIVHQLGSYIDECCSDQPNCLLRSHAHADC